MSDENGDRRTLRELQQDIAQHVETRGWTDMPVRDTFLLFVEEVGELAHELRKHGGLELDSKASRDPNLEHELADLLIYLLALSNALGVQLDDAYRSKREEIEHRSWNT